MNAPSVFCMTRPTRSRLCIGVDVCVILASALLAWSLSSRMQGALPWFLGLALITSLIFATSGVFRSMHAVKPWDSYYGMAAGMTIALPPLLIALKLTAAPPSVLGGVLVFALLTVIVTGSLRATWPLAWGVNRSLAEPSSFSASRCGENLFYRTTKRALDVFGSLVGLLIFSPIMAMTALTLVLDSGFPILFRQCRVGRMGVPFHILKFRTMRSNAGSAWARPSDDRITRLGALLRRSSIDELPQFFNVLTGQMSLVGPRPEMEEYALTFRRRIAQYDDRHGVKPGITGWAQVYGERNFQSTEVDGIVALDLYYVHHCSLIMDLAILYKTAVEFLFHRAV